MVSNDEKALMKVVWFAKAKEMIKSWAVFVIVLLWPSENFAHRCIENKAHF